MCYNVRLVDLAANAMIETNREGGGRTFFPFSVLEEYGKRVVKHLEKQKIDAELLLSRNWTEVFLDEYDDVFELKEENGKRGVALCSKEVDAKKLIQRFRGYLPLDLLLAYVASDSIQALGIKR